MAVTWLGTFHPWNNLSLHGCKLCKHLWDIQSWKPVSFSTISGTSCPAWLCAFQASLGYLPCMAVSFSSIPGASYPGWLSAFQPSLEQPILHGCQLFKHLWGIHSCMAVSFSTIPETTFPAWLSASQSSLGHHSCELFNQLWNNLEPLKHVWGILS